MKYIKIPKSNDELLNECKIETFRSGGKGGQHANKTESAVRLTHLPSGITASSQDHRSQYLNKLDCLKELRNRIIKLNHKPKMRIKTKPTRSSIEKRLKYKKQQSEKKKNRKKSNFSD